MWHLYTLSLQKEWHVDQSGNPHTGITYPLIFNLLTSQSHISLRSVICPVQLHTIFHRNIQQQDIIKHHCIFCNYVNENSFLMDGKTTMSTNIFHKFLSSVCTRRLLSNCLNKLLKTKTKLQKPHKLG